MTPSLIQTMIELDLDLDTDWDVDIPWVAYCSAIHVDMCIRCFYLFWKFHNWTAKNGNVIPLQYMYK